MTLLDDLPSGSIIGLDSAPFIYLVEAHRIYRPVVEPFFTTALEHGRNRAVTSVVTLAEVLVQPMKTGRTDLQGAYRDLLTRGPSITLVDLTPITADLAAQLRSRYGLRLPDAFQLAAAIEHGASHFITNDTRLKKLTEIRVLVLDDYLPG